jgi:hypothetical protein
VGAHAAALIRFIENAGGERGGGGCPLIDLLVRAYEGGVNADKKDQAYRLLLFDLESVIGRFGVDEVATVIKLGDPVSWPGLTAAAVSALGNYFGSFAAIKAAQTLNTGPIATTYHGEAGLVLLQCFGQQTHTLEHYQRLGALSVGLGSYLANLPQLEDRAAGISRLTLNVLRTAPAPALKGPLSSWVSAFAVRARGNHLSVTERKLLKYVLSIRRSERDCAGIFDDINC